ncbi:TPA: hypothetical protein VPC71_001587 [Streptococcus pyogenes]|uniref:Phage protein n=2 Tax=Streptococcus pyogenes TaxID=1314 RepID=A0ABD7UUI0_STRPY|nr:hypothetical protein [Streptococcus pyogenes]EPZ47329.1 hypothetical protein HMPREF1228_1744 [Streptococcus pyogenes GA41345]QBX20337.1 hypothetical protein Javan515_0045 [Streptococcus phage Javan515]HEP6224458.1 hypothetical protein [Streptococcus pyogenes ABC020014327]HEP6226611.1 hypothetical protein [Streptococcus pyogenes ABC020056369]HEP6229520.1 hypothetical protein [Streptococcus pyogenes ABC020013891]HEP6231260.1 hypothetical protein [Streptococcus pyogenes ABC020041419]HEP62329
MVGIRINGELVTFDSNFRDALIFTIDCLRGSEEPMLKQTYQTFKDYTDEDLMDYIETEFDVWPELIVNRKIDSKWSTKQHILDD